MEASQQREQQMRELNVLADRLKIAIVAAREKESKAKTKANRSKETEDKLRKRFLQAQGVANDDAQAANTAESERLQIEREYLEAQRRYQMLENERIDEKRAEVERDEIKRPE